ncbi:MAG TPA: hypothetical protein VGH33_27075, partial [Isosphaeraceae bacterium]
ARVRPMPDPRPDSEPEIADASLLFGGPEAPKGEGSPASPADTGPGYAVEGPEPEADSPAAPPIPPIPRAERPRPASKPEPAPRRARRAPSSGVDQLWSRGAEWGTDLTRLGVAVLVAGFLLYSLFRVDALGAWVVLLAFSVVGLAILAYPIFITLERPVRVTPEQAVKDYFGALSHRVPHYRRMWLLLSLDGRAGPGFGSFPAFKAYWTRRLAEWKAEAKSQGVLNPITVEVADFKSEKSAGQTEIDGEFSARVMLPGQAEPVASYRVSARFVRGADKMWYLEKGTLD